MGDELSGPEAEAALEAVGLDVSPDADPRDLSGGERQRLALAIALAGQMEGGALPGLVALDEPCLLYTSPSPRDRTRSRMPASA